MDILLETYYILLPIIATALIGWVGVLLKGQRAKEKARIREENLKEEKAEKIRLANSQGIMLILRYMLKRYHSEYMIQGAVTYAQYKDWQDAFETYTALGGNSIALDWDDDIENLPKTDMIPNASPFEMMLKQSVERENNTK